MNSIIIWQKCRQKYQWTVDLKKFDFAKNYPGFFMDTIAPISTRIFEDKFQKSVIDNFPSNQYVICGEVYFWKNYRSLNKNTKTDELLQYLAVSERQKIFIDSLKLLAKTPDYQNFSKFRDACNLPNGFATPITYLSFYQPDDYPMIDRIIANWWRINKHRVHMENAPLFSQRKDGWIQAITKKDTITNWNAYFAWVQFCNDYRRKLTYSTKTEWRARDVEMAVWESQKRCYPLDKIT